MEVVVTSLRLMLGPSNDDVAASNAEPAKGKKAVTALRLKKNPPSVVRIGKGCYWATKKRDNRKPGRKGRKCRPDRGGNRAAVLVGSICGECDVVRRQLA